MNKKTNERLCKVCGIRPSYKWKLTCSSTACMLQKLSPDERRMKWKTYNATRQAKIKALYDERQRNKKNSNLDELPN